MIAGRQSIVRSVAANILASFSRSVRLLEHSMLRLLQLEVQRISHHVLQPLGHCLLFRGSGLNESC